MDNITKFTKADYDKFESLYNTAVLSGKDQFIFKGQDVLVNYAKYVIEYLSPKFKDIK